MTLHWLTSVLLLALTALSQQPAGEQFYQPIREGNLTALRALIKQHGTAVTDSRRQTPLMLAAAFGTVEAMQALIDAGADVNAVSVSGITALHLSVGDIRKASLLVQHEANINARSQMGRTPLIVASATHGASDVVRLLLEKGADVQAADASGLTPLISAAAANDTTTAKLLLERGANVVVEANVPQPSTPLMAAAHNGNLELTRLFLARKAPVNVKSGAPGTVKNGPLAFSAFTALHAASLSGNPDVAKALVDAGANVNAVDIRGLTPLVWAISTDRPNLQIVKMLLENGADLSIRSKVGETAADWARKFNNPRVMAELKISPAIPSGPGTPPVKAAASAREAVERSMPLLQSSAEGMLSQGGCIACHGQDVTHVAATLVSRKGWKVNSKSYDESLKVIRSGWITSDQGMLQGIEAGGWPDIQNYASFALTSSNEPVSWNSDVFVRYLLSKQRVEGNWHVIGASRAPIQDGDISRTAMSIRTLSSYAIPARKNEIDERISRAASWIAAQTPISTEDRVMQLLGLKWADKPGRLREDRTKELLALQRSDGGWAQTPYLSSDAYATGEVLYTLREMGFSASDAAVRKGVEFLLKTQRVDGSWYVPSRAMKIQPYFQSGFPYDHDQWISSAATAWAAMGLAVSTP
jgi:ankyrin repeat protein